ncbi:hypothetical protein WR164_14900 [Philodulcilactobacillus myokoensis]|uniref:Uncharacterized protein n=1 Tax=Philodulcilactobacillus myokoensis TaxID=2929573 RepID=A0A9W6ESX5_9LACO|nr:hypothetical protein [Philodulcilactobacillus myokoensis]GLB47511.1 hypothetical protein WR164_14900 [Philodulcilactobacillus myokoensis]
MKISIITRLFLRKDLKAAGYFYIFFIMGSIFLSIIIDLIFNRLDSIINLNFGILNLIDYASWIFILIYSLITYRNFKFLIQNGISRTTFWEARISSVFIISVVYTFIDLLIDEILKFNPTLVSQNFITIYNHDYFNSSIIWFIIISLLNIMGMSLIGIVWGSFRSLFSKKIKLLLRIVIPFLILFSIIFMISDSSIFNKLEMFYSDIFSTVFYSSLIDIILLLASYFIYQKLQIKKN